MENILLILITTYSIVMTIVFIVFLIIKVRKHEKSFYEYQDKKVSEQLNEMNHIYMAMRGWRHDYHNHMQTIKAHIALEQLNEVSVYLEQMETELDYIDTKYKSGNISVDAILNSKLTLAEKSGLQVKCDAVVPKEISINQVDLCILLGNLIDNAIEACEQMDETKVKFIRVYICTMKKQLYISISNATNEVIRKLDNEYITKKRGKHGHGLKRINLIVEKYGGFVNRQNEPGAFATEIVLPM